MVAARNTVLTVALGLLAALVVVPAAGQPPTAGSTLETPARGPATDRVAAIIRAHADVIFTTPQVDDLSVIAADPDLVRPGHPDASELYNRLATARTPPATRDLAAVRDWIRSLSPLSVQRCRIRTTPEAAQIAVRIARDLEDQLPLRRPKLRYLSLAALKDRCHPAFAEADRVIVSLIRALSPQSVALQPVRLDPDGVLWRIDLDETSITPQIWDRWMSESVYRAAAAPALRADWLAAQLTNSRGDPLLALVQAAYREPLDGDAAAVELGVDPGQFRSALWERLGKGLVGPEAAILTNIVSRRQFELWYPQLLTHATGQADPRPPEDRIAMPPAPLMLAVVEREQLSGALLTLAVSVGRDCALEVIDVDPTGRATLLFPNDFQRNNIVAAGTWLELPGPDAAYQLRLNRTGSETLIAECRQPQAQRRRTDAEFVQQRFLDLGDWGRAVLASVPTAPTRRPSAPPANNGNSLVARTGVIIEVR